MYLRNLRHIAPCDLVPQAVIQLRAAVYRNRLAGRPANHADPIAHRLCRLEIREFPLVPAADGDRTLPRDNFKSLTKQPPKHRLLLHRDRAIGQLADSTMLPSACYCRGFGSPPAFHLGTKSLSASQRTGATSDWIAAVMNGISRWA